MPLYKKFDVDGSTIALWRIDEDISFFESKFNLHPHIQNESKKLQWFATRHLLNEMFGTHAEVLKYETGKPYLKKLQHHISISHTSAFAAVMVNAECSVGIDLEMVNPKVERIAHKFLRDDEISAIEPHDKIEKLILYWSAKEALYKMYGKHQVEFKNHLLIEPFEMRQKGVLYAEILTSDMHVKDLEIQYEFFENHVVSYVSGAKNQGI